MSLRQVMKQVPVSLSTNDGSRLVLRSGPSDRDLTVGTAEKVPRTTLTFHVIHLKTYGIEV